MCKTTVSGVAVADWSGDMRDLVNIIAILQSHCENENGFDTMASALLGVYWSLAHKLDELDEMYIRNDGEPCSDLAND